MNDLLTEQSVREALYPGDRILCVRVLSECDSTNSEARRRILSGNTEPSLIVTERQTAGRGRLGRSFYSPAGTGIYFSLSLPSTGSLESSVSVTCAASVAVMRAIRRTVGKQTQVKWVNDLLLDGKKVCGILTEAMASGDTTYLISGIGINLRPADFPPELPGAGSLNDTGTPRSVLLAAVVQELLPLMQNPDDHSWLADYRAYSCVLGKAVRWSRGDETYEGVAESIDSSGGLRVRAWDGRSSVLRTGEVSVRTLPDGEWKNGQLADGN